MQIRITSLSKLSALLLLVEKPCHGYELIKGVQKRFGYRVSSGQVYPFLSSLVRVKFVKIEKSGTRDKKIYALTPAGKKFAKQVIQNFDELVELAISKKVHKCAHCGCRVLGKSHVEKIGRKKMYFCCSSCAEGFSIS